MNKICSTLSLLILAFVLTGCSQDSSNSQDLNPIRISSLAAGSLTITKAVLQFNEATTVAASFKKSDGTPAIGISVNFSTTLGIITPANGIAVTDGNGTATVQLTAGTISGKGQVTASATVDGKQFTKTGLFDVTLPPLKLSEITLGLPPLTALSYGGSTSVSVKVMQSDGVTPYTGQEVDVAFASTQASQSPPQATITPTVRTVNGVATVTYQATTATGNDTVTASIAGDSKTATIAITPLSATSISFVSASPTNIGLKGMGGAGIQETSTVTFKVLDTTGQPKSGQQVDFTLNTSVGGLSLTSASASTQADGTVSTIVQAGVVATPVRVTATLRGTTIVTQSDQLVVSTGVPAQDGFSISIQTLNTESWNTDGVQDLVTARLSDHFHNPVPDGTAVSFTTSGGSIQPSCTTSKGSCSVTWTSQAPRPANGRARILAYAVGEEAFIDLNGSGLADLGEFTDTSEAFRDDDESGARNPNETFIDFNGGGVFNPPDGLYNGVLQGPLYTGAPKSKHVFGNTTLVMASSAAQIANSCGSSIAVALGGSTSCSIAVDDLNGNTMPVGTKVAFSYTEVVSAIKLTSDDYIFPNTSAHSGVILNVLLTDDGTAPVGRGVLKVTVTSPSGVVTTRNYSVN